MLTTVFPAETSLIFILFPRVHVGRIMVKEMSIATGELLLILFGLALIFAIIYGTIAIRWSRHIY